LAKRKDTDYLGISARIRAMENSLLTRDRMERMLDARTDEEAVKVLAECGYGDLSADSPSAMEVQLAAARDRIYQELQEAVPVPELVDVFRAKYDYHNAKVLVKAEAVGADPERLLAGGGRYLVDRLREEYQKGELQGCSPIFNRAVAQAKELLASSGDPQLADFLLDRAYFEELLELAGKSGSQFLTGYVRVIIDAANLRSVVRAKRMERGAEFLTQVLIPGGTVDQRTLAGASGEELTRLFSGGWLAQAAEAGAALASSGSGRLTEFERLCDNGVQEYLAQAKRVPFGEQPVVSYLYAREAELTAIRILMAGRRAGLERGTIEARLRKSYV
jgi:V/A-type H+-transporting ATPase subunit C